MERSQAELRILKAAEFPDIYDPTKDQSLEAILQQKNKKLESDLVHTRNNLRELQSASKATEVELKDAKKKNGELEKLITRYEESAALAVMPPTNDSGSVRSASTEQTTFPATDSIVTVLTNQRDRLRKQNQDFEEVFTPQFVR